MPKLCPNITFPHQQDFFPIRSVTKSSTARFSHENLVKKFKIFVQAFVPIRTALRAGFIVFRISQVFPWHFYFMREHSLVELTEHDDSAANIIVHSMYTYMYCCIHSTY